ncbi:hypothetical protein FPQ18DRAFT_82711 [Pyronema domesticum]|uniref:Uncharacterized protein n=1 Tax=Pyronema omphalodes (strain CBS 100304) TaxID=1076935 RepID=U4L6M1_PYROM|nr:hypothetical protein FPQ18DRAFT_82711 [Pyronema domesticum]CCX08240.1 Protein of unknown function [Pyronema omphalodes CBS 100304]
MANFYPNANSTENCLYMYYPNGLIIPVVDASGALRPASLAPGVPTIAEMHTAAQKQQSAHEKAVAATNAYMAAYRAQRDAARAAAANSATAAKKQAEEKAAAEAAAEKKKKAEMEYLQKYMEQYRVANPVVAAAAPAPAAAQAPVFQYAIPQFAAPPKPANQTQLFWMPGAQAPMVIPPVPAAPAPKAAEPNPAAGGYYTWQKDKWVYKA